MSCLCNSSNKMPFLINNVTETLKKACNNSGLYVATLLEKQDYEDLGQCLPTESESNTNYSIKLIFHRNRTDYGCNNTYPFYWRISNNHRSCVDGKPINPQANFTFQNACNAATIRHSSSKNIYNFTSWTPCNHEQQFICQLDSNITNITNITFPPCNLIPTTAPTTSSSPLASTETIAGSVIGTCVILLILILFFLFCKKNQAKKSTSKNQTQTQEEDIYSKLV